MPRAAAHTGETVGERLRRLRIARGVTQRDLARPGVSYAYISRIEAGTRRPSVTALRTLASALGVSPAYLETGSELDAREARELRLADAELALRLTGGPEAEIDLHEIAAEATAAGDVRHASRALLALGLVAAEIGDHQRAVDEIEAAFALERPSPLERLDVYATLGRSQSSVGRSWAAIDLYRTALAEAEALAPDDRVTATRLQIMLAYALSDAGELRQADEVLQAALAEGATVDDPTMRVRIVWSLARLSEMEGRSVRALSYARQAIALLQGTEDTLQAARAHVLAAWIMNSRGDAAGADAQLAVGRRLFGESASADDRALLLVESARAAAGLGDGRRAVALANAALALVRDQYVAIRGTALWALANGLAVEGDRQRADRVYAEAVDTLCEHSRWREASDACRAWVTLLRAAGDTERARVALERAIDIGLRVREARPARTDT